MKILKYEDFEACRPGVSMKILKRRSDFQGPQLL